MYGYGIMVVCWILPGGLQLSTSPQTDPPKLKRYSSFGCNTNYDLSGLHLIPEERVPCREAARTLPQGGKKRIIKWPLSCNYFKHFYFAVGTILKSLQMILTKEYSSEKKSWLEMAKEHTEKIVGLRYFQNSSYHKYRSAGLSIQKVIL